MPEPDLPSIGRRHWTNPCAGPSGRMDEARLITAARDKGPVRGLTHRHYRYPAGFSPQLAAAAIAAFTSPGDMVADPFAGGGTTLVEAMAARRRCWGVDISTLATFVSSAKTLTPGDGTLRLFRLAVKDIAGAISMSRDEPSFPEWSAAGYFRNMDGPHRWRLRKAIAQAVAGVADLDDPEIETLARCAVLRAAQWALEGRRSPPTTEAFRSAISGSADVIAMGSAELSAAARGAPGPTVVTRPTQGLQADGAIAALEPPRLILTSPPYPGVHVLYHRWQVDGRRETPAPFFIANALDGSGDTYYTMGGRKVPGLPSYFAGIASSMASVAKIADERTTMMQVVAFTQPEWQLQRYLDTLAEAGWREFTLGALDGEGDGRLWRTVPNRRWYADQRGATSSAREVVLLHRLG